MGAGYGLSQAARFIPWDCSDWQAFAHDDRATAILETLAENRGKTLYCGIDQSDTFAKAETWAAGRDRNERDDTVYWGERGSFRGFIAAQEGWLTDGESGITGQSIATIFEFPKEQQRRTKKVKRLTLAADPSRLVRGPNGGTTSVVGSESYAQGWARTNYSQTPDWDQLTQEVALAECRSRGYPRLRNAVSVAPASAADIQWRYTPDRETSNPLSWTFEAYQVREYTATCQKTVRRTRN